MFGLPVYILYRLSIKLYYKYTESKQNYITKSGFELLQPG
jgi:hypothetical protein